MKNKLYFSFFALVLIGLFSSISFKHFYCSKRLPSMPEFLNTSSEKIDSLEKTTNLEQKLLNCFIIINDSKPALQNILLQGSPAGILLSHSKRSEVKAEIADLNLINQKKIFLAIKQLEEFENSIGIPAPLVRGAVTNDSTLEMLGAATGCELKQCGINFVFSSDLQHCLSPTPSAKSYHASFETACRKSAAYQDGMVSHNSLIYLSDFSNMGIKSRPEQICHLIKELRDRNLPAVSVPKQSDLTSNLFLAKKLKDSLDFKGLILQNIENNTTKAQLKHKLANGDLFVTNASSFKSVFEMALSCLKENPEFKHAIERSFHRVLLAQYWTKANVKSDVKIKLELNKRRITEESLIYLGQKGSLPILNIKHKNVLLIYGDSLHPSFSKTLKLYTKIDQRLFSQPVFKDSIERLVSRYQYIIVLPTNRAMSGLLKDLAENCNKKQLIIYTQTNSSILNELPKGKAAILFSLPSGSTADELAAQAIFGGIAIQGKLPYNFAGFKYGDGYLTNKIRLKYSIPEDVGIKTSSLDKIDSLVREGISQKAFPGCQVLLAKDGIVFYRKAFGTTTYESATAITTEHIYDLASVTKIASIVPSLMRLVDDGKFKPDTKISSYLHELKGTDKAELFCRELLLHEAGLPAWMPYFSKIFTDKKNKNLKPEYFSKTKTSICKIQISDHLFLNPAFEDSFLRFVFHVKLKENKKYEYTDLGYYFLKEAVERITKQKLDLFTEQNFFAPIGANSLCYDPLNHYSKSQIVPTEFDKLFRNELIHAYAHDPGAALMGDVAGHAGLFSNANDLAKLMQVYLQMGSYGGYNYFSKKTIQEFTQPKTSKECTRGLGFDKQRGGPISPMVSPLSYGHTGFTGTVAWNDPTYNLVYIFLSNRVYPDATNNKLLEMATRKKIQEVVYRALKE